MKFDRDFYVCCVKLFVNDFERGGGYEMDTEWRNEYQDIRFDQIYIHRCVLRYLQPVPS